MLENKSLYELLDNSFIPENGRRVVERIRESEPSRRVQSYSGNVCVRYPSVKMGCVIQAESHTVELCFIYEQEYDSDVYEYYDQPEPLKLNYVHENGQNIGVIHTPDFFILSKDYIGYVECKTEEQLLKLCEKSPTRYVLSENGSWSCPPGEKAASAFGLSYKIWSDKVVNWVFQENMRFLEDYFRPSSIAPDQSSSELVIDALTDKKGLLILDLIDKHKAIADSIYWLISRNEIYVDLLHDRLSEPERTYVFIDQLSSIAYQELIKPDAGDYFGEIENVTLQPGEIISWDGISWTILNIGDKNIAIKSDETPFLQLPIEALYEMISRGEIKQGDKKQSEVEQNTLKIMEQTSAKDLQEANRRWEIIGPILSGQKKRIDVSDTSQRTLRRYLKRYRTYEQELGNGYLGLIPDIKKRGNRTTRLPAKVVEIVNTTIEEEYETAKAKKAHAVYAVLCKRCDELGLIAPSLGTFMKAIKSRPQQEQTTKRQGKRAAYNHKEWYWRLDRTTPKHGNFPFEICHIDHTELDIELRIKKYGRNLGRPWLTIMIDASSRTIVGFYLSYDPPSHVSCMMVLRDCVKRHHRLPNILIVDRGKEFESIYFESLLAYFQVIKKSRPSAESRFGSVCERVFGTSNTQLIHNLIGNTKATRNVRTVTKSINPRNLAIWDISSIYKLLSEYFMSVYACNEHPSLHESPERMFELGIKYSGRRAHRIIPFTHSFIMRTLPTTRTGKAKVNPTSGIQVKYIHYWHECFRDPDISGSSVPVKYDPDDSGIIFVYVRNKWVTCISEMYSIFKGRSRKEIAIATLELSADNKITNKCRTITARRIATLIENSEEIEKLLVQRLKDEEKRMLLSCINHEQSSIGTDEANAESAFNTENMVAYELPDEDKVKPMGTF